MAPLPGAIRQADYPRSNAMANIDPWNPDARKARIKAIKAA